MRVIPLIFMLPLALASQNLYQNTDVLELDSSNFKEVVLNSNQTSLVKFYAPWCGHCQSLRPQYLKVGKHLDDIANIGAVNCDSPKNKKLCAEYRVQGYPTVMAFRPPKYDINKLEPVKFGHATETFNGPRKTKQMVEFATGRIKNYVKRIITDEKLNQWLKNPSSNRSKFVIFTRKDKLSPFLKSVAVEYLGDIDFAYFPLKGDSAKISKLVEQGYEIDENGSKAVIYFFKNGKNLSEKELYNDDNFTKEGIAKFLQHFNDSELDKVAERVFDRIELVSKVKKGEKLQKKKVKNDGKKKNSGNVRDEL